MRTGQDKLIPTRKTVEAVREHTRNRRIKNKAHKRLRLKKAQQRLTDRIRQHDEICKKRTDDGRGFRRPGSMKVK